MGAVRITIVLAGMAVGSAVVASADIIIDHTWDRVTSGTVAPVFPDLPNCTTFEFDDLMRAPTASGVVREFGLGDQGFLNNDCYRGTGRQAWLEKMRDKKRDD